MAKQKNIEGGLGGTLQIERRSIAELSNDPANARKHNDKNIEAIIASLRRFGQQKPIVIDRNNIVRAGNGTLEAARRLGWDSIDCVKTSLEGSDAIAYAIADNRTAELAEWDDDVLAAQLNGLLTESEEIALAAGWTAEEIEAMVALSEDDPEITEDDVPEPPVDPITKPGDLWIFGEHRLLCGDSTKAEDVERLMGGKEINIAFTSPPYASQRKYDESSGFKPIPPDDFVEWFEPIAANVKKHLAKDGSWFVNIKEHCEDGQRSLYVKDLTLAHVRSWEWRFIDEFIWTRPGVPMFQPNRFKNGFEPVFHFSIGSSIKMRHENVKTPTDDYFQGGGVMDNTSGGSYLDSSKVGPRMQGMALPSNVVAVSARASKEERGGHTASFPVGLPSFFIKAFTDNHDNVYDPFCGSGTTLIAAEQLGRKCYGMEISPQYCDVIVKRWETLTGNKAVLEQ
jgi:DNA modification methylase